MTDDHHDKHKEQRSILHDRWDIATYEQIRKEMVALPVATEALKEIVPDTGWAAISDAFMSFMKSSAELLPEDEMRDSYRVNRAVAAQMQALPVTTELRRFTRGDRVAAAMATVKLEPDLEILFDQMKEQQKAAEELERLKEKLQDLINQLLNQPPGDGQEQEGPPQAGDGQPGDGPPGAPGQGQGPGEGQEPSLEDQIEQAKAAIEAMENALKQGLADAGPQMGAQLQNGLQQAVDDARDNQQAANAFGIDPGTLVRMPADERIRLAKQLDNPRIDQIAENFGPLANLAWAAQIRRVDGIPHEFVGLDIGDDLEHVLPEQLVALDDEDLVFSFLADYADRQLLQYKLSGTEKVGKGGIVLCEDGSGSMSGARELWAKAFMLVLLNIAKKEARQFHLLHFGSAGQLYEFPFLEPADFTVDKIIQAAEVFCSGGTDFATPLNRGIAILEAEYAKTGKVQSDIVMLTDGQAHLSRDWIDDFVARLHKIGGTCWAVLVGGEPQADPLFSVAEGKTCRLEDLTSKSKKEVRSIFAGLQRPEKTKNAKKNK